MRKLFQLSALLFAVSAVSSVFSAASASYSCLDDSGKPVDRWIILKEHNSADLRIVNEATGRFVKTKYSLENLSGAVARTLAQVYDTWPSDGNWAYALYNDQAPDGRASDSRAHAKGIVVVGKKSGFWLSQSLPRFPNARADGLGADTMDIPDFKYGQHFQCVTLGTAEFEKISKQMMINWVLVYDSGIGAKLAASMPNLASWIQDDKRSKELTSMVEITTLGGKTASFFAKSKKWENDFYGELVADFYTTDLVVESWRNGDRDNKMEAFCRPKYRYSVQNAIEMSFDDENSGWNQKQDHSKWAVSNPKASGSKVLCIADLNRQFSQRLRGGGALCWKETKLWNAFVNVLVDFDPCTQALNSSVI